MDELHVDELHLHLEAVPAGDSRATDIVDFSDERRRHAHFFGRRELLAELDTWIDERRSGWLVLTGAPGAGKSAIFNAWIAERERVGLPTAFHFIRRGQKNWAEPAVVRANLAGRIEQQFPEQRDPKADPVYRLEQLLGRVAPVLAERNAKLVLVVDGLDEALTRGESDDPIPRIFPLEIPHGIFVFVGSRPQYPRLNWFDRRSGISDRIDLDERSESNEEAVREAWQARRIELTPTPDDALIVAAIRAARGNMLHAVKLFELWNRPGAKRDVGTIPQGFTALLEELWARLSDLGETQKKRAREGLALLCAAREPLPLAVLEQLLGWDEGDAADDFVPSVREMLVEEHWHEPVTYTLFHEAFREHIARKLPNGVIACHGKLVEYSAWPLERGSLHGPSGLEFRHLYALRHRVAHQLAMGDVIRAGETCRDVGFLAAKMLAVGPLAVERDVHAAARVQPTEQRRTLETLVLALGACAHWVQDAPEALPVLLHDRLLSFAPHVHRELVWPPLREHDVRLRHPLQRGHLARVIRDPGGAVRDVAALPDGRIVSASADATLRIWDPESGELLASLEGHDEGITRLITLPSGRIVSASWDGTVRLWEADTGRVLAVEAGVHVGALPDGRIVIGSGRTVRIWDVDMQEVLVVRRYPAEVDAVIALSDGRILSASADTTLSLWDDTGNVLAGNVLATLHDRGVKSWPVTTLSDGRIVFAGTLRVSFHEKVVGTTAMRLWDPFENTLLFLEGHGSDVTAIATLPNDRVVSASADSTVRLWDPETGECLDVLAGHHAGVTAVAILPDGGVVSASKDRTLRIWNPDRGTPRAVLEGHEAAITTLSILSDRIVSASDDGTLRIWQTTSTVAHAALEGHRGAVRTIATLPGRRIVTGSEDTTLRIWDVASGVSAATLAGHGAAVTAVTPLLDGRIVSASKDHTMRIWDGTSGMPLVSLAGDRYWVMNIAALPDGRIVTLVVEGMWYPGAILCAWNVDSAASLFGIFDEPETSPAVTVLEALEGLLAFAVLPDGRLVVDSEDRILRVWDPSSGPRPTAITDHHDGFTTAIVVLPDGRIVSASDDLALRSWDLASGSRMATLTGHSDRITGLAALPGGRIVSASRDRTLRIWDLDSGSTLAIVRGDAAFLCVAAVEPGLIVAGDAIGNVWFLDDETGRPR